MLGGRERARIGERGIYFAEPPGLLCDGFAG